VGRGGAAGRGDDDDVAGGVSRGPRTPGEENAGDPGRVGGPCRVKGGVGRLGVEDANGVRDTTGGGVAPAGLGGVGAGVGSGGSSGGAGVGRASTAVGVGVLGCVSGAESCTATASSGTATVGGGVGAVGLVQSSTCIGAGNSVGVSGTESDGPNSSAIDSSTPIFITPPHTEQRARTPREGTLEGSTRKIDRHSGHETFTSPPVPYR
jgi:hypothetical protein